RRCSEVRRTQSATHVPARTFAPGRFGFSTYKEQLCASFRSAKQTESCNAICATGFVLPRLPGFGKTSEIEVWIHGRLAHRLFCQARRIRNCGPLVFTVLLHKAPPRFPYRAKSFVMSFATLGTWWIWTTSRGVPGNC